VFKLFWEIINGCAEDTNYYNWKRDCVRIDGNLHARGNWEKLRFVGARGISGFLEQQESPSGTQLAARRHTRDAWCSDSRKTLFFVFSWNRNHPMLVLYHQVPGS